MARNLVRAAARSRAESDESLPSLVLKGLGRAVRELRRRREMTLKALADASGLSERFLSALESGRSNISVAKLVGLAQALGVRPVDLLAGKAEGEVGSQVIALLGLRGAGKTSVGQALAERLGLPFYELDRLIETEAGVQLSEIFAFHGEAYFRRMELQVLEQFLAEHPRAVLATGGGVVTSPEAFRLLSERTRTVWLKATPEEHWRRVVGQGDLRPMQNRPHAMAELRRRLREREPLYSRAEIVCSTSGRPVSSVASDLARQLSA
jgi:XRE family transcriptional regulator, aerobic/anaerobic benzoate catabolism transcriptional regulator